MQVDDLDVIGHTAQNALRPRHLGRRGQAHERVARGGEDPEQPPAAHLGQPIERRLARGEAALGQRHPPQRQGA
jgi:hypothetical protein